MKPSFHLTPMETRREDGQVVVPAKLVGDDAAEREIYFRVPEKYESLISDSCDPFVLAVLFYLLKTRSDMHVHGRVSKSLLRNLEEFQDAWTCWRPTWYEKATLTAGIEVDENADDRPDTSILAFSGGADSCFTAWRHHVKDCGRSCRDLSAGVMVHGFDIGLDEPDIFENAFKKSDVMAESIGIELIPVATNQTSLGAHWGDSHGAAVISCLVLLKQGFRSGFIASSSPYNNLHVPWGSNPITDWMLGSNDFPIIHDGASFIRREKIRAISEWPEAMVNLRVCWQGDQHDKNCGLCEKCIRTILSFRVMNKPVPPCFECVPDSKMIAAMTGLRPEALYHLEEILDHARTEKMDDEWVAALDKCVRYNQRLAAHEDISLLEQLRRKAALRTRLRQFTETLLA